MDLTAVGVLHAPEAQLDAFVAAFDPAEQKLIRAVRAALRQRLPMANELLYDYYTFFVLTWSPTEHPTDGIFALAGRPDGVRLYLMQAPKLPDPKKLLKGSGKQARYLAVESASRLQDPEVEALLSATIAQAAVPLPASGMGRLVTRTVSSKRKSAT